MIKSLKMNKNDYNQKLIEKINGMANHELIYILDENPEYLGYLANPSKEIIQFMLERNGENIQFLLRPSEESQLLALDETLEALKYIENPSEKIQKYALSKDISCIEYFSNLYDIDESLQLEAIDYYPAYIKYIKNPSYNAQLAYIQAVDYYIEESIIDYFRTNSNLNIGILTKIIEQNQLLFNEDEDDYYSKNVISKIMENPVFKNPAATILKSIKVSTN